MHGTGNVRKQIFWALQSQKRIQRSTTAAGKENIDDFIMDMLEGNVKQHPGGHQAHQCVAIGLKDTTPALDNAVQEGLLRLARTQNHDAFFTASNIIRGGQICYSKACSKVKKRNYYTISTAEGDISEV